MIDCQPPAMSYRRAEVLALPFKRRYEKIEIMPEVSRSLSHGQTWAFHLSLRRGLSQKWLSFGHRKTLKQGPGKGGGVFRAFSFLG